MKQFKGMKDAEQIKIDAEAKGWEVDFEEWDKGSDWFYIRDVKKRMLQIAVNCFGRFFVYSPKSKKAIATERTENLENKDWYNEILELLYEPLDA